MRRASPWAVTRVNPEQALKVRNVDADSALTGGRPPDAGNLHVRFDERESETER